MPVSNEILLTLHDARALTLMLANAAHASQAAEGVDALDEILAFARIVPEVEIDGAVAAMGAPITYEDLAHGVRRTVVLTYPRDADPGGGLISVLSPVGRAVLGRRVGTIATVDLPSGSAARLLIHRVGAAATRIATPSAGNSAN